VDQPAGDFVTYQRARFRTSLPAGLLYTTSHFWIERQQDGLWRVGFTRFAVRLLGELVEHEFEVQTSQPVVVDQILGWVEGFKTATDLPAVVAGRFITGNPELHQDLGFIDTEPYGRGWLYAVDGVPDPRAMDVQGYAHVLDRTIDGFQRKGI
jgi:glycine cleavage system H protein